MKLYPAQQQHVTAWLRQPAPRRKVWVWDTGTGKTAGSLQAVELGDYRRVLIICPAMVRRHWLREVGKWTSRRDAAVIELGRNVKVSRTAAERRESTYAANIQIVSYDLVGEVDSADWDLIIFDEVHHLATPSSQQARRCEGLLSANFTADVLGLTATLIPTEAAQVWNPLRLLFGVAKWGKKATTRNQINWNFRMRYCHVERTEYGVDTWGCRPDRREELANRMKPHVAVLHREDIIADMPPLDLSLMDLPTVDRMVANQPLGVGQTGMCMLTAATLVGWAESCAESCSHIVILVHRRALVEELRRQLLSFSVGMRNHEVRVVTGAITPTRRQEILDDCSRSQRCILIGTHDSVAEGVRMMWPQQVMIDEWSLSPGRVLQVLGRFQSVGSQLRPSVHLRATADTWNSAEKLLERVTVVQDLLSGGEATANLANVLRPGEPSPEDMASSWLGLFDNQRSADMTEQEESA